MNSYPSSIVDKIADLAHAGKIGGANAVGTGVGLTCGSFVRFYVRIDTASGRIIEARYKTNGCGFATAAAELLAEEIAGKGITELHGFDTREIDRMIAARIGEFPRGRQHCSGIALDAVRGALADYRAYRLEEYRGEKALICTCFGISEETIEVAIKENSLETVEEVTRSTRAGGGCGSCRMLIQEMLDHRGL